MNKFCRDCGSALNGRSDKKFCDDGCRTSYHNQQNSEKLRDVNYINRVLKRNLRILSTLNPGSKTTLDARILHESGLNLYFYTHIYTVPNGKTYKFCYNQGYTLLKEDKYQLIKKEFLGVRTE